MKKTTFKKLSVMLATVSAVLVVILCIHIYLVTHPKGSNEAQRVMARIDFKQDINEADASKITAWLYQQSGVDHVLCNPETNIAVFTFSPTQNNADAIILGFRNSTAYMAERYMPNEKEMMAGCPVSAGSFTTKVYNFFKNI